MRLLLTGATGLIGSAVHEKLRLDHSLFTLGRQSNLVDAVVDLSQVAELTEFMLPEADCLVHCAGVIDEEFKADPMSAYKRATYGTEALLVAAAKAGCRRFIYVSSSHVYGLQMGSLSENSPPDPQSHYALAHYCTEQMFKRQATACGGSCIILRPNAVYGLPAHPDTFRRWSLIPFSFPREAMEREVIVLKSSGLQRRNFVSTGALADIVRRCIDGDLCEESGVINVLGAETESVYDFAQRCCRIAEGRLGRPCSVDRSSVYMDSPVASAGSDFELISRFEQPRPSGELNEFIRQFTAQC